jgi:hypothetical protein
MISCSLSLCYGYDASLTIATVAKVTYPKGEVDPPPPPPAPSYVSALYQSHNRNGRGEGETESLAQDTRGGIRCCARGGGGGWSHIRNFVSQCPLFFSDERGVKTKTRIIYRNFLHIAFNYCCTLIFLYIIFKESVKNAPFPLKLPLTVVFALCTCGRIFLLPPACSKF